jgi:FkbM family methyltransferase
VSPDYSEDIMQQVAITDIIYQLQGKLEGDDLELVHFLGHCLSYLDKNYSQNYQDIFALMESNPPGPNHGGVYVEFGATDGKTSSNTYLLHELGWGGALAEPNPVWHDKLRTNRASDNTLISNKCIHIETGTVEFRAPASADLGTIVGYGDILGRDDYDTEIKASPIIKVETIRLVDFLTQAFAKPTIIDYMSVDTEGSELDLLTNFFKDPESDKWDIRTLTIEHNYNDQIRDDIHRLMVSKGYKRKYTQISRWDDFYVKEKQ